MSQIKYQIELFRLSGFGKSNFLYISVGTSEWVTLNIHGVNRRVMASKLAEMYDPAKFTIIDIFGSFWRVMDIKPHISESETESELSA